MTRVEIDGLSIDKPLYDFLVEEALPGTGVDAQTYLKGFSAIVHDLAPKNRALLERRDEIQAKIDAWHRENGAVSDPAAYEAFLREIGYIVQEGPDFAVSTEHVDPEIAVIAGPQLVVPIMNARYALNAANARWGSLYDGLYGTDAIGDANGAERGKGFNPVRCRAVTAWVKAFLDDVMPLEGGSWNDATGFSVNGGGLKVKTSSRDIALKEPSHFAGYRGEAGRPSAIIL